MKYLNSYLVLFFSFLVLLISDTTWAQLDSCNVFLQGKYVEVGINWNGAYGSSTPAPTGYHPKGASYVINSSACGATCSYSPRNLGFVADPAHDGWTVGTPPYYGDYFMPGSPQEGWSIMADGVQANAWNGSGCATSSTGLPMLLDSMITGAENIGYYDTGRYRIGVWRGMFDSLQITQVTRLDTIADYFTIHVFLENLGAVTRHDIYYLRTVDPDNDEAEPGGSFSTINKIEYQLPNPANRVLVTARGTSAGHPLLALGTHDTTAKCFLIKTGLTPSYQNLDSIYNGNGGLGDTADYMYQDSLTVDAGIGLLYKISDLPPSHSTHIVMAYVFSKSAVDSALNDTTLISTTQDTTQGVNIINKRGSNIHVYPNPFTNELTVTGLTATDYVNMYDMLGRKVNGQCSIVNNGNTSVIKVGNSMPGGMYVLQVIDNKGNIIAKIPLQKH